jgi:hypothetical protein
MSVRSYLSPIVCNFDKPRGRTGYSSWIIYRNILLKKYYNNFHVCHNLHKHNMYVKIFRLFNTARELSTTGNEKLLILIDIDISRNTGYLERNWKSPALLSNLEENMIAVKKSISVWSRLSESRCLKTTLNYLNGQINSSYIVSTSR